MSRNGSGIYNLPTGNPVVTGTTITSNWGNTTMSDIATALTGSVAADGQTPITGNLQMGSNKITGMASGTALTDAATVAQAVPTGAILMWSGSIATIPTGWLICDGTNGTPDLRSRFIVGAGSTYAVNATGGSNDAIVVAHTHTGTTGAMSANATHSHGITDPSHQHSPDSPATFFYTNNAGSSYQGPGPAGFGGTFTTAPATTGISVNSANTDHTHNFTSNSTGSSGTNANLPPYLALAYIMKA
jgi:hypothetical protein